MQLPSNLKTEEHLRRMQKAKPQVLPQVQNLRYLQDDELP